MQNDLSLQAARFRRLMLEQRTSRFLFEMTLKASEGTDVIPVLSQMILDRVAEDRAALCLGVKTPGFWYHSLIISKKGEQKQNRVNRDYSKWICFLDCAADMRSIIILNNAVIIILFTRCKLMLEKYYQNLWLQQNRLHRLKNPPAKKEENGCPQNSTSTF